MKSENRYRVCSRLLHAITFFVPSFVVVAALPEIEQSSVEFRQVNTKATISYELKNAPAIVTLDIETNTLSDASGEWVSIGGENMQTLSGDVHKVIRAGARKITWQSRAEWPEKSIPAGQIRAVVTAWPTNAPPDYLVIGLDAKNDVRLYAKPDFVPYGINSDYYKTNAILMRKIPAAGVVWCMGAPNDELEVSKENEIPHLVMLTADYYMGVYELTQGQLVKFYKDSKNKPKNPSNFKDQEDSLMRPAEKLDMTLLRGMKDYSNEDEFCWPSSGYDNIAVESIIYQLRTKCGLSQIDLPTEAQWEYACRAGTTTAYNNGSSASRGTMELVGWFANNSSAQTHVVGLKQGNDWGLYDMHGNVQEFCLDRMALKEQFTPLLVHDYASGGVTVDPIGPQADAEGINRKSTARRGGGYSFSYDNCRSGSRSSGTYYNDDPWAGCRLCTPAVFK